MWPVRAIGAHRSRLACSLLACSIVQLACQSWTILLSDPGYMSRKIQKFQTDKLDSETNGSFDSCNSCKRLGSRLHELHGLKFRFVTLSNLSVRNSRIFLLVYPWSVRLPTESYCSVEFDRFAARAGLDSWASGVSGEL